MSAATAPSPGWQAAAEIARAAGQLAVALEIIHTEAAVALTARFEPGAGALLHDTLTRIVDRAGPALAAYRSPKTGEPHAPDPR